MKSRFSRRLTGAIAFLALVAGVCASPPARAAEVQVPFDAAGRIQRVDEPLARRIGLFVDRYPGFQEARLFSVDDSTFVLEVTVVRGGTLARERETLTTAEADALRLRVTGRVSALAPTGVDRTGQEGRPLLLAGSSILGLGFYGWAVPVSFNFEDNGGGAGGSYLITAGLTFFVPFFLTQHAPVSYAMTNLTLAGASRGIVHGWYVHDLFANEDDDEFRGRVGAMMTTSMVEGVAGYLWARGGRMDAGTSQTVVNGMDFGFLWGLAVSDLSIDNFDEIRREVAAQTLGGVVAGTAGFRLLAARRAYSYGDATVMRSAGYVGTLFGVAAADAASGSDQPYGAGMLVGSVVGLIAGDRLVAHTDFTAGQSFMISLGTSAGGIVGLGIAAASSTSSDNPSAAAWLGLAIGSTAGLALTYHSQSDKAVSRAADRSSWRFELAPEGLLAARLHRDAPLVRLHRTF